MIIMIHKVGNVGKLYEDATHLYNNLVIGGIENSADSILGDLATAIDVLKNNWKGKDAGYRIQEVIGVYNAMVAVRNMLAQLARDSSKVAVDYRDIQIANGSPDEAFSVLSFEVATILSDYSDTADTVDINDTAKEAKKKIDYVAESLLDSFLNRVNSTYDDIMGNWTSGPGRENAVEAFKSYVANVNKYKATLSDVSLNITKALQNYNTFYEA